jgi:hypothetical protein
MGILNDETVAKEFIQLLETMDPLEHDRSH